MIHYDPHKWLDHFFDIRGSLVKEISGRVFLCVAFAALVSYVHLHHYKVGIPSLPHTLMGPVLGLLLVFRTNSSYDRFWEGRKLWGGIVNETRNLVRSAVVLFGSDRDLLHRLARLTAVFPPAATAVLRGQVALGKLAEALPAQVKAEIEAAQHPALAVAVRMTECLEEARRKGLISDILFHSMDQNVQLLVDYVGGCERIRRTPLPFAYVVHLRRAVVLYCLTLPFALVETFGWSAVLDVALVSYLMLGIEEIGVEIEGPFGNDDNDLPLEDICETIHRNLYALAGVDRQEREALEEGL
jgi:putative membrane protein